MKYRNWQIPYTAPQPPEALLRAGYSPLLAVLLALRGDADPVQARAFLSGGDQSAFDPMLLQDMDKAVARIRTAIERRENVAVFGDYDVDGITSTCVLTDYLRRQGVPVHPYIPDRIEEGYGLNMDAITNLQRTSDITLIITVDCGITAIDETNYALQRGIDMVITDHHECSGQAIPNAVAVVDPKRPGSQYPNSGLAGVGVAYKLLCALEDGSDRVLRAMNRPYDRAKYLDLIGYARKVMPDLVLTSDVIIGFPGETEAEAMETVDLVRQVEFDALFTFIFSPRPGTPAAKMDDPVPRAEKQKWFDMLCSTQNEISARLHAGYVGRTLRVLVDGETDDTRWPLSARTAGGRLVHLVGDKSALGQYRDVKITDSNTWALFGEMLPASKERCSFDA